jgi:hypothetical protein
MRAEDPRTPLDAASNNLQGQGLGDEFLSRLFLFGS